MNSNSQFTQLVSSLRDNQTQAVFQSFFSGLSGLEQASAKHPALLSHLKMMHSLGTYLQSKSDQAHPETINCLTLISENAQTLADNKDLSREAVGKLFKVSHDQFKKLKQSISSMQAFTDEEMDELHSIFLAIEWEITDETLSNFEDVVNRFLAKLKPNSVFYSYLKMIQSTGQYIVSKKVDVHTDSIEILNLLFAGFNQIVRTPGITKEKVKEIFKADIERFQTFKDNISLKASMDELSAEQSDELMPALTHLKSGQTSESEIDNQMTGLPEADESQLAHADEPVETFDEIAPALSGARSEPVQEDDFSEPELTELTEPDDGLVSEDFEDIAPALSGTQTQPAGEVTDDDLTITALPDSDKGLIEEPQEAYETIEPALTDNQSEPEPDQNVMDDLFNAKESPADELLDAIHLMDVHGSEDHALKMLDRDDELEEQGIQNFPPTLKDTAPIQEIEDRLDQFFDLEKSDNASQDRPLSPTSRDAILAAQNTTETPTEVLEASDSVEQGITPFDQEDESIDTPEVTEQAPGSDIELDPVDPPGSTILDIRDEELQTLQSFFQKPGWETDRWSLQSIQKECYNLTEQWPDDDKKRGLAQIIISLSRSLEEMIVSDETETVQPESKKKPKGFWGTLKAIFID